ncbi:hypothetical protein NAPIS_ORF00603, partial [Vairimorpha apis BRL 01]
MTITKINSDQKNASNNKKRVKRSHKKNEKDFELLTEIKENFEDIKSLLKCKSSDKKTIEQKIDLIWINCKSLFCQLLKQKNMFNNINLLFTKGNNDLKNEIFEETLKNIVVISIHEYSKQFVIILAKHSTKYLVGIIKHIKLNIDKIVCSRNGLYVIDEVFKLCNRKSKHEIISEILHYSNTDEIIDDHFESNVKLEFQHVEKENENIKLNGVEIEDVKSKCQLNVDENNKNKEKEQQIDYVTSKNFILIRKLSSKRCWNFEITHYILHRYINEEKISIKFLLDLFIRNKQLHLLLYTYKGLEVGLNLLDTNEIIILFNLIQKDFSNLVNDKYGVIYILKFLELNNVTINNKIIDIYTNEYKSIFIEEISILPILYFFNQEAKYYPTLFNTLRQKKQVQIDK